MRLSVFMLVFTGPSDKECGRVAPGTPTHCRRWLGGSRYLVDGLPLLFAYILHTGGRYSRFDIFLAIGALAFNVYGTLWLFLEWA